MRELLTVPRILELGFNLLGVGAGIAVIVVALRVGATFTLLAHRRVMRLLVATAILIVSSEGVGIVASLSGPSTLSDVAEEFAELVAIGAASVTLLFMSRAERDEISALRHSADVDDLTGLSSRSFFHRAAARRIELARANGIPVACVLLDIDDFKAYNDMHGHGAGDDILRCVARACEVPRGRTTWWRATAGRSSSCWRAATWKTWRGSPSASAASCGRGA
jgi:predicted signal transduction protein with EAL and GGDEF domain